MKLFVKYVRNAIQTASSYQGLDNATITQLLTDLGATAINFITETEYDAFVLANQPVPLTPAQILTILRSGALDNLNISTDSVSKLQRAILMVILDEINVIRALLPGPPAPRTIGQLKTAIQTKINAGTAD